MSEGVKEATQVVPNALGKLRIRYFDQRSTVPLGETGQTGLFE